MTNIKTQPANWYEKLNKQIEVFTSAEFTKEDLKTFILLVARDQYRDGVRDALKLPRTKNNQ